jgi:hypothetical protein
MGTRWIRRFTGNWIRDTGHISDQPSARRVVWARLLSSPIGVGVRWEGGRETEE